MKWPALFYCCCSAAFFLSSFLGFGYATVGGQYSVNVHFVAPLVTAPCSVAQFWTPPNVVCGLCFCMTGSLSRCIPQPGCNPASSNSTTTTTPAPSNSSMTASPGNNTSEASPGNESNPPANPDGKPNENEMQNPEQSPTDPPTQTQPPPSPEQPEGGGEGTPSKQNKLRGAKPGKSRRRRHLRRYMISSLK